MFDEFGPAVFVGGGSPPLLRLVRDNLDTNKGYTLACRLKFWALKW